MGGLARVKRHFIDPGKPMRNAIVKSCNGKFRDDCADLNRFMNLAGAKEKAEQWRVEFSRIRPHGSPLDRTPEECATHVINNEEREENPLSQPA